VVKRRARGSTKEENLIFRGQIKLEFLIKIIKNKTEEVYDTESDDKI